MRHDLTDDEWALLEPLLPDRAPQRGGQWGDHRPLVNGPLWRTGAPPPPSPAIAHRSMSPLPGWWVCWPTPRRRRGTQGAASND